jgi:hypothetical protein
VPRTHPRGAVDLAEHDQALTGVGVYGMMARARVPGNPPTGLHAGTEGREVRTKQSPSGWAAEAKVSFLPCYDSSTPSHTHE